MAKTTVVHPRSFRRPMVGLAHGRLAHCESPSRGYRFPATGGTGTLRGVRMPNQTERANQTPQFDLGGAALILTG